MGQVRSNIYRVGTMIGLMATLPVGKVLAEDTGLSTTSYDGATTATSSAAATGIIASFGVFILIIAAISIAFFIWWIFMLVDAFKRTNWNDESQKTTWLVILIVGFLIGFGWLATILYYFMIRKPLGKATAVATSTTNAPAASSAPASSPTQSSQSTSTNNSTTTTKK